MARNGLLGTADEVAVQSMGLGEALSLWFSGQKLDGVALYGVSVLWWARAAKIATYVGGLTVILDIIGPERIRSYGAQADREDSKLWTVVIGSLVLAWCVLLAYLRTIVGTPPLWLGAPLILVLIFLVPRVVPWALTKVVSGIAMVLEDARSQQVVRIASILLLSAAFFVDLLSS